MRAFVFLLVSLVLAGTSSQAGELLEYRFSLAEKDRRFLLYVPDAATGATGKMPLLVVLHGIGSTSELVMEKSLGRFNELADEHGFIVVYPNGLARNWDLGEGRAAAMVFPKRDDLAFVDQVIAVVAARYPVDQRRIFATGFSLGGQMSFALACTRPGLMRAVATVAMPLPAFLLDDCSSGPAFAVALIHGASDIWVPYFGGTFPIGPRRRDNFLSHDKTLEFFLRRNRCNGARLELSKIDGHADGTSVVRRAWNHCAGAPVLSYTIIGGGHTWPQEEQGPASRPIVGRVSQEINAADEIWEFFSQFR